VTPGRRGQTAPPPDEERSDARRSLWPPVIGLCAVLVIGSTIVVVGMQFRGGFASSVPVTVLSQRAGLVMNPDAKVKMRDIVVGRVASIDDGPDGTAEIHLAMDPAQLALIPENVRVDVSSSTVFGAKFVQLMPPTEPARGTLRAGQVVDADQVTVEFNTVFEQLNSVLTTIEPEKLNATLSAMSSAFSGRGAAVGQTIKNLDAFLTRLEPSLPNLSHDLEVAPTVLQSYADAAPDLLDVVDATADISKTITDEQNQLDTLLISVIGLAGNANDVVGGNRAGLTDALSVLLPTTALTNQYNEAIYCGVAGILPLAQFPPLKDPGVQVLAGFLWGQERWRYPENLPKVAAKGGPQCTDMPRVAYQQRPPYLVTDTNANPWAYGNRNLVLNSAGLKEILFGPNDGPPRNSAQIGQPG
jgi:phospholipid/cholesterol/gamma-HCH transport system substrate-binding protein